jgi:hypothetical protein
MAYTPVSGIAVQYSTDSNELASGYWLKFYISNTSTPLLMATDYTGDVLLVKCKINTGGFPITDPGDNTSVFIPYVSQSYRQVIFRTEADADANNTAAALVNIPHVAAIVFDSLLDAAVTAAAASATTASTKADESASSAASITGDVATATTKANEASASATAAASSESAAATSETSAGSSETASAASEAAALASENSAAADLVLTNADVVLTHADVVLTHADVVLTNADVAATADKLPKSGGAMTGPLTTSSTIAGRNVAVDGTKLDTVESAADVTDTANVTAAGATMKSNNLSDLLDASASRSNLGVDAAGTSVAMAIALGG